MRVKAEKNGVMPLKEELQQLTYISVSGATMTASRRVAFFRPVMDPDYDKTKEYDDVDSEDEVLIEAPVRASSRVKSKPEVESEDELTSTDSKCLHHAIVLLITGHIRRNDSSLNACEGKRT
jgi:hypothetical protein